MPEALHASCHITVPEENKKPRAQHGAWFEVLGVSTLPSMKVQRAIRRSEVMTLLDLLEEFACDHERDAGFAGIWPISASVSAGQFRRLVLISASREQAVPNSL